MRLIDDITAFLEKEGFECSRQMRDGFEVICTTVHDGSHTRVILPLEILSRSTEDACKAAEAASGCVEFIRTLEGYPLVITEDRWHLQKAMTRARLLAHLEVFSQAFARNCEVRRIEKEEAQKFLQENHSYGYAACRYRYGLFLMRQTGHLAERFPFEPGMTDVRPGDLIAVATFSNARKWIKGGKEIRSYEWTRYASLPGMRVNGGMGKVLKAFITEVCPDDIMTYADLEWSKGDVYKTLGFRLEGQKEPVMFAIDKCTWKRTPVRPGRTDLTDVTSGPEDNLYFRNFGSNKYRLKLTDYE